MSRVVAFTKMVGTGNDFIIVDTVRHRALSALRSQWSTLAKTVCDRRTGIGADGVLVLEPSRTADCRMRVLNADGSEAEMCGNGARCVAAWVSRWPKRSRKPVTLETKGGLVRAEIRSECVHMQMPDPKDLDPHLNVTLDHHALDLGFVNTGVPHVVLAVDALDEVDVEQLGHQLRYHQAFAPRGTNVNFLEAAPGATRVRIRTYERGVEGETLACGTGATAAAIIHAVRHVRGHRAQQVRINLETRSGDILTVAFRVEPSSAHGSAPRVTHVILEGPVQTICEGTFSWPLSRTSAKHRNPEKAMLSC